VYGKSSFAAAIDVVVRCTATDICSVLVSKANRFIR